MHVPQDAVPTARAVTLAMEDVLAALMSVQVVVVQNVQELAMVRAQPQI